MKICTVGLWHLGIVTSACLAHIGHEVVGLDFDDATVASLRKAQTPIHEPGLPELLREGLERRTLQFDSDPAHALDGAEVVWITYDTPVDEDDRPDVESVIASIVRIFPYLPDGVLMIVSSQLPVGSVRRIERLFRESGLAARVAFGCSPENLRLGKAIEAFLRPARVVAGVRDPVSQGRLASILAPLNCPIEWMSVESAEMTKHALNAFLATSVAFINEIDTVCEATGADAHEVGRGLKSDPRIGAHAYLSAGAAFAGGTLARDVTFLSSLAVLELIPAVKRSNDAHLLWTQRKLEELWPTPTGRKVAIWGLTYKAGTDTLRRSAAIGLIRWLNENDALVTAYDPVVHAVPDSMGIDVRLASSAADAAADAEALVIATEWPQFREAAVRLECSKSLAVLDANGFLREALEPKAHLYLMVGRGRT